ncbi:MAG TPA: polyprenyl synthetase family protein [Syntrophales bacterium]|nr:polyprenyl synthetase family protein [Syntrophales bacterium]
MDKLTRLEAYLRKRKEAVDQALERFLPGADRFPEQIFKSVRYSVFAGGKRVRPIMCIAAAEAVCGRSEHALPAACAIEMIHSYSLIHDDLPAMDNDDYRRGRLTNHKVFGEAMAILAGDALLTEAFRLMAQEPPEVDPGIRLAVIRDIAEAAGIFGMVGGQAADILYEGKAADADIVRFIHNCKTGAMIRAAVRAGAMISGAGESDMCALTEYGAKAGLAFQIADDILNVEGEAVLMGKSTGSDNERRKTTYPALFGIDESRRTAVKLVEGALRAIDSFDERAEALRLIAKFIIERRS